MHETIKNILFVQPQGIGDMVMMTPMLNGLRSILPDSHISILVASRGAADVVDDSEVCDEIIIFNRFKAHWHNYLSLFRKLWILHPDVCFIAPHVNPVLGELLSIMSRAEIRIGHKNVLPIIGYTHFDPSVLEMHKIEANHHLLTLVYPDAKLGNMVFHIDAQSEEKAQKLRRIYELDGHDILGVHPGCDKKGFHKRYPVDNFNHVINFFLSTYPDARCVIFIGPDDVELSKNINWDNPRIFCVENQPLRIVAAVIRRVRLMLTTDSGLGHVANAMGVPVVSIFGPANPSIAAPVGRHCRVVQNPRKLSCMPCINTSHYGHCDHRECLTTLQPEYVVEKLCQSWESLKNGISRVANGLKE
jgi:ADP-heptose:LPS heptosyltransferase